MHLYLIVHSSKSLALSSSIDGANDAPVVSDFVLLTNTSGTAGADLIAGNGGAVLTGTLDAIQDGVVNFDGLPAAGNPVTGGVDNGTFTDGGAQAGVLDAGDTLTAFGIDANSDVTLSVVAHNSSFYVASNAAFDIFAQSSAFVATDDFTALDMTNISFSMALDVSGDDGLAYGSNAQNPGTFPGTVTNFDEMSGPTRTRVFEGTQRTASAVGGIASQSVRFDNTYTLDDGSGGSYDLSMGVGTVQADVTYTIYVP